MDVSGDVADLMVKESIQLTEASIKLLAAGAKIWRRSYGRCPRTTKSWLARPTWPACSGRARS